MDPFLIVLIVAAGILGGTFLVPKMIAALKPAVPATDGTTTTNTAKASALTSIASLKGGIQAWLSGLGMVEDVKRIEGEVDLIAAFAFVVIMRPRIVKIVDPTQQPVVEKAFGDILAAIGGEKTPEVA